MKRNRRQPAAALLACCALLVCACASVPPWERGRLAKPYMAPVPDPVERELRDHTYRSREATLPSGAGSGGGCGCY